MTNWDETFDLVVVGSGGGGLCTAMSARDLGHTALILESTELLGGSTAMSGGVLWVPNHPLQQAAGVDDSREASLAYLKAVNPDEDTPLRWRRDEAFVSKGPEMVSFLIRQGIPMLRCEGWSDYHDELPGGCPRSRSLVTDFFDLRKLGPWLARFRRNAHPYPLNWPDWQQAPLIKRTWKAKLHMMKLGMRLIRMRVTGAQLVGAGSALQARMLQAAVAAGVEIRTKSPVIDLVRDEAGRVTGVEISAEGKTRRIAARHGVVVTAGGFSHNQAMREEFGPKPANSNWSHANPGDDGSMVSIMMRHGAETGMMDNAIWLVTSLLPGGAKTFHLDDIAKPHTIMVNREGKRFTDEAGSYLMNGRNMYANGAYPGFVIMDSRHRERYMWAGAMPGKTPPEWISGGYLKKADTIEDLARICGIDVAGLKATIERFNRFAETGVDADFNRGGRAYDRIWGDPTVGPNPVLGAISKGPFYAAEVVPGDVGTAGGVVIDEHARVLDKAGAPIEGLYAAGNCTASVFGRCYPGAGASIASSFAFGYIASQHALRGTNAPAAARVAA